MALDWVGALSCHKHFISLRDLLSPRVDNNLMIACYLTRFTVLTVDKHSTFFSG
jgi:hypothetical protein